MNKHGSVNDLRWSEHAGDCKVIHADGSVTYEEAQYWSHWQDHQKLGRKRTPVKAGK